MNAIELLKQDHEKVKKLLEDISDTTERAVKKRADLLNTIATELEIHTTLEEEIFYPAFKKAGSREELQMFHEAKEEHRAVEALVLPDLLNTDPGTVEFAGRLKVMKELLEHHIEEEEQEMFKNAKKLMSKQELDDLGKQMEERKQELMKSAV